MSLEVVFLESYRIASLVGRHTLNMTLKGQEALQVLNNVMQVLLHVTLCSLPVMSTNLFELLCRGLGQPKKKRKSNLTHLLKK